MSVPGFSSFGAPTTLKKGAVDAAGLQPRLGEMVRDMSGGEVDAGGLDAAAFAFVRGEIGDVGAHARVDGIVLGAKRKRQDQQSNKQPRRQAAPRHGELLVRR